ncbi:MAG: serpin family protein [Clostridiales bacterium]|nr:serpin family protein [Clostridiales bacterium]
MKEKKIFDGITDVHDDLIIEAKETKLKKKNNSRLWLKWTAAVACLGLIFSISLLVYNERNPNTNLKPIMDIVYPKAYAFEDSDSRREIYDQNPVDDSLFKALNDFSYKTSALILRDTGENINYSPLSLYFALSLAASGADGETKDELLTLLGVSDIEVLSKQCGNLYRTLYRDNEIGKLKIANSIWMDDDMNGDPIVFKNDFVKNAAENFYASSHSVDFADKRTGVGMARWVSENTNGTLSPTIETSPEQILTILNTVYFYDQWINRFDKNKTIEDVFYLSNGREIEVDYMNQTFGSAGFHRGEGFTRASLSLKNTSSMIFILPDEGVSTYDLLSNPEQIQDVFNDGESFWGEVVWKVPKFSFSSKLEMNDVLKSLGINSAFQSNADFTGITDHMAFISDVKQETHIAIDEDGVEASAFTQIDYAGSAPPDGRADMILNRPFIYGITAPNGSLLFVGVCENPAEY